MLTCALTSPTQYFRDPSIYEGALVWKDDVGKEAVASQRGPDHGAWDGQGHAVVK
jgi:hypothetical protein